MFITNKWQLGSQYSIHIQTVFLYLLVDAVKRFVHLFIKTIYGLKNYVFSDLEPPSPHFTQWELGY